MLWWSAFIMGFAVGGCVVALGSFCLYGMVSLYAEMEHDKWLAKEIKFLIQREIREAINEWLDNAKSELDKEDGDDWK